MSTVILSRWADVRSAYRHKELRQALYDAGEVVMADCLLNLHGQEHRDRRRLENRLFRRETFQHWEHDVLGPAIDAILDPYQQRGFGDLVEIGYRLAMNLTATIAGLDVDPTDRDQADRLHRIVGKLSEGATMAHTTRDPDELRAEVEAALMKLDEAFLQPSIARRTGEGGARADVLSTLLEHRDSLGLGYETIRREIGFYLQAGAHSTANALVHTFHLINQWIELRGLPRSRVAGDAELLQRALYEALRLHPASPVALRRATAAFELVDGTAVETGDLVELDLMAANRDRDVFGVSADDFDPERDVPPNIPRWGNSFGGGVHSCIGQELDGGVPLDEDHSEVPLLGTVTVMLMALMERGFVPDPASPPEKLSSSTRAHYGKYPVTLVDAVITTGGGT